MGLAPSPNCPPQTRHTARLRQALPYWPPSCNPSSKPGTQRAPAQERAAPAPPQYATGSSTTGRTGSSVTGDQHFRATRWWCSVHPELTCSTCTATTDATGSTHPTMRSRCVCVCVCVGGGGLQHPTVHTSDALAGEDGRASSPPAPPSQRERFRVLAGHLASLRRTPPPPPPRASPVATPPLAIAAPPLSFVWLRLPWGTEHPNREGEGEPPLEAPPESVASRWGWDMIPSLNEIRWGGG